MHDPLIRKHSYLSSDHVLIQRSADLVIASRDLIQKSRAQRTRDRESIEKTAASILVSEAIIHETDRWMASASWLNGL
jgi:hypothetical protein